MSRRTLPIYLALAAGFLILGWGLVRLQQVFRVERDDAKRDVRVRQGVLARYAERALAEELEDELRRARPEIEKALDDPLAPADHLLYFDRGERRLPRRLLPRPGESTPGADLFDALRQGRAAELRRAAEPDSPWAEHLALYQRFAAAVAGDGDARAAADVASTFRAILGHRQRFRVERTLDLPYMLALLDLFAADSRPDPGLMRALLHEGLSDDRGGRVRDLSRLLLESRDRFTAPDFEILSDHLVRLAESSGAPYQAFLERVQEEVGRSLDAGDWAADVPRAPALVLGGRFYVAPAAGGRVVGVAVDFDGILARIGEEMRRRGLIAGGDEVLGAEPMAASPVAIDDLRLRVTSAAWGEALRDAGDRYLLKTGLILLSGIFALMIVSLAVGLQHRRRQLVELKADFVATVSHELRTPLASVRLLAETLERRLDGDAKARDYPSRIVREIDRLAFLVENILSFHRLEKGRWRIRPEDVPLSELVDFLRAELELQVAKPVRLTGDGVAGRSLRGDPELLKLLFLNLARNAFCISRRN